MTRSPNGPTGGSLGQKIRSRWAKLTVGVHFVDHVLQLSLGRVLAQGAHHGAQFLGGDGAVTVLIKLGESLLQKGPFFLSFSLGGANIYLLKFYLIN